MSVGALESMKHRMRRRRMPILPALGLFLAIILVGVPAFFQANNLLVLLFGVIVSISVVAAVASRFMLRGVSVHRLLPDHAEVGEPVRIRYRLSSQSRWFPSFCISVRDTLPDSLTDDRSSAWVMHLGPGDTVHGDAVITPVQRGRLEFRRVVMESTFPYGMLRRRRKVTQPQELVVFPRRYRLRSRLMHQLTSEATDGPHASKARGAGQEWFGTRVARPGDPWRDMNWKASAHRGQLVALDRVRPGLPRAMVLLDLSRPTEELVLPDDVDGRAEEERAIELAASVLAMLHRHGHEFGLTIVLDGVESLAMGAGHRHLTRLLGALARIDLAGPRGGNPRMGAPSRAAVMVVQTDRVRPISTLHAANYLLSRRLDSLREVVDVES